MSTALWVLVAVVGLLVVLGVMMIGVYNRLVSLRNRVREAWSQVDVQLRRRYDLIPNLVETVKGYAAHERETLENVIKARQMAIDASTVEEQQKAENFLTQTLRSIFALAEAYPNLKADENFRMLQEELAATENKIAFARQRYNALVQQYQTLKQSFPANMIGGMWPDEQFFEVEEQTVREAPRVEFTR